MIIVRFSLLSTLSWNEIANCSSTIRKIDFLNQTQTLFILNETNLFQLSHEGQLNLIKSKEFDKITTFVIDPRKSRLFISNASTIGIFDPITNETTIIAKNHDSIFNIVLNHTGDILAVLERNEKITLYEIESKAKKTIKNCENLQNIIFHPGGSTNPYAAVLGREIRLIDYIKGKIIEKFDYRAVDGCFSLTGDRFFTIDNTNALHVFSLVGQKIFLINDLQSRFKKLTCLSLAPEGRIVFTGSLDGWQMWDITIPKQETDLIYTQRIHDINAIYFYPDGHILTGHSPGHLIIWNDYFILENIRNIFYNAQNQFTKTRETLRKIPQWITQARIDSITPTDIEIAQKTVEETEILLTPSILIRFQPPNFPFWLIEVFSEEIEHLINMEKQILQGLNLIKEQIIKVNNTLEQEQLKHLQLLNRLKIYLETFVSGQRVNLSQIANYIQISTDHVLLLLRTLEREKQLKNGRLITDLFGNVSYIAGVVPTVESMSTTSRLSVTDTQENISATVFIVASCYYCGSQINTSMAKCVNCGRDILKCSVCKNFITKNQERGNCPHCQTPYHLSCLENRIKVFGRCNNCRKEISEKDIQKHISEEETLARVNTSIEKMYSIYQQATKKHDEKNEDEKFNF